MPRRSVMSAAIAFTAALGLTWSASAPSGASSADASRRPTGHVWTDVSAGVDHTCGIRTDHSLWCWGYDIGDLPVQVDASPDWASVEAGYRYTCGLRTDHTLWCYGRNDFGQLGVGDREYRSTPTQVGTDADWTGVSLGFSHTCATRLDHTLWCWGHNASGELGLGDTLLRKVPTQVGDEAGWRNVATSGSFKAYTCATRTDHTLWCWGKNDVGQLGLGDRKQRVVPTQVGSETTWDVATAGDVHTCATRLDNAIWCWGDNTEGQLGLGDRTGRLTPTQVGADTDWKVVDAGWWHNCARRTDGALWCWGDNYSGALGIGGGRHDALTPTRVGGDTNWTPAAGGYGHTCAIRVHHTLWCWGDNLNGQLGLGDELQRSVPTRV